MTFKDWTQSLWDRLKSGNPFGQDDMEFNRANGGHSGYHPNTAKNRALRETARQAAAQAAQAEQPAAGWDMQPDMQPPMGYTGFTGTVPPQATGYQPQGGYASMPPQATGYQQGGMTGTGYQQPMGAWQEPAFAEPQPWSAQPTGYQQPTGYFQAQPQTPPQPDNISYMPGNFVGGDGRAYRHIENVAVVSAVSMCYRIIEYMRNSESVIVNTEQISDETENQRCLDMLYGAARAMHCTFTRVAARSIYLIAPEEVMVVPYDSVRRMSDQDMNSRWPADSGASRWEQPYARDGRYADRPSFGSAWQDSFPRRDYAPQDDRGNYGGYRAVNYGR